MSLKIARTIEHLILFKKRGDITMRINEMFKEDINREINGVIKVDQDTTKVIEQEVEEYVITRELKKHFITFFNYYADSIEKPTADVGVWISGFFGSGKSHFLKMLSYILQNKEVNGVKTVERFRTKFEDDPATYMTIEKCTHSRNDTILFNIAAHDQGKDDKSTVRSVFAQMFYKHLGFCGERLNVAALEYYIEQEGKTEEFRKRFEELSGKTWLERRKKLRLNRKYIVQAMVDVLGIDKQDADSWLRENNAEEFSVVEFADLLNDYLSTKPDDYRLIFLVDEVGQYIGENEKMLLDLQTLVEILGARCKGRVWILCTGQEALDKVLLKLREDKFSKIQARFKTRLSLSSASADEVIQKRLLKKNDEAKVFLENTYEEKKDEMANLFKFRDAIGDIRGFETSEEFSANFPFVPYQFILMQKVFSEIRKHGNTGIHFSGGERSMLSGFQEAAQKVQYRDENTLVPFYMFYDTVHTFLDGSIRRVIERCERAIADGKGLEEGDQNVLKLLYLIRYVDDVPAKLDNIIILMADDIEIGKLNEKTKVQKSLDRLIKQNYIARTGDTYNFLTDVEQDVEREIRNEYVEPGEITIAISDIIFGQIYRDKKFRYNKKYDFDFDKRVDDRYFGNPSDNMEIQILTMATSAIDKNEVRLMAESSKKAICVLADTEYYSYLENAMKIKKYARKKNVSQFKDPMQSIVRNKQEDAERFEENARLQLVEAFKDAKFYIDGERVNITSGTPKDKINQVLNNLVGDIYSELDQVNENANSDQDILDLLNGEKDDGVMEGFECNRRAANEIETYLISQHQQNLPTSMADVQKRFQSIPYGWREIDVAYVTARLIYEQKVTIKYNGETIRADNNRLPELLRKKTEIGKTKIKKREEIALEDIKKSREFLRRFFYAMDVPEDDDGLSLYIMDNFNKLKRHYEELLGKYSGKNYPEKNKIVMAGETIDSLLKAQSDNIALVKKLIDMKDELYDMRDDIENIEGFFDSQVETFNKATELQQKLRQDKDYLLEEDTVNEALNKIRLIVIVNPTKDNYDYTDIPKLNRLMKIVHEGHDRLLNVKKADLNEIVRQCMEEVHSVDDTNSDILNIVRTTDDFYTGRKKDIEKATSLTVLESYIPGLWSKKDDAVKRIQSIEKSIEEAKEQTRKDFGKAELAGHVKEPEVKKPKHIKKLHRQIIFPGRTLETEEEIDAYVDQIRNNLKIMIKDCDGIDIN